MKIQEVSRRTGLSVHTLRHYERVGVLSGIGRDKSGHRCYSESDLGWIEFLQMLTDTGMPLEQVKAFMALERGGSGTLARRQELLCQHRDQLMAHIQKLTLHLARLDGKITYYASATPQSCPCLGGERRPDEL